MERLGQLLGGEWGVVTIMAVDYVFGEHVPCSYDWW